jgi:hydroxymethylpyrimidine/phosphomethylpyrimidine kinase
VSSSRTPVALSIAGSDSGGGAGIQADLKAFARCGVHGATAITAITAQNTVGVSAVHAVPPDVIAAQVRAVVEDLGVDAVKVGMLGSAQTALAVAAALDMVPDGTPIVVDPVMVAESGARLLDEGAQLVLVRQILPRADVVTPNVPEARALIEVGQPSPPERESICELAEDEIEQRARDILGLGPHAVVVTGGHRARATDVYRDANRVFLIAGERHPGGASHGSGCTHSSVLAASLARGLDPLEAARAARRLAGDAVAHGLRDVGRGPGPVDVLDLKRFRLT